MMRFWLYSTLQNSTAMALIALAAMPASAQEVAPATAEPATAEPAAPANANANVSVGEIVVTARRRAETLNRTPVVVSVVGEAAIARNNATDLTKIAELTPTVMVGNYGTTGGGTISIRGINSPANNAGFEQAVSVSLDGVQTSDGHVALLGFFDVQQVEVLKGPQTLLFSKNNTAGVISVKTNDPTSSFEASVRQAYEFVADETTTDAVISGPLSDTIGARLAVRYRWMDGWMRNTARPIANPFYRASTGAPAAAAQLPGTTAERPGTEEFLGRLTLKGELGPIDARLKLFGARTTDDGPGAFTQNIGPCVGPNPRVYGIADPTAECRVDNRTTSGDMPAEIAQTMPLGNESGRSFGKNTAFSASLDLEHDFGGVALSSTTAYVYARYRFVSGNDQTTYSQLFQGNVNRTKTFSQELRLTSDFDGPLNFMVGGFYQRSRMLEHGDVIYNTFNYNAAANRYESYEPLAHQTAKTLSAFAQLSWAITPELELAGGARFTRETKDYDSRNLYGIGGFATQNTVYAGSDQVGVLQGRFEDNNVSPEATLTWHPSPDRTLFVAYRTGFKSGGFGITNPLQTTTLLSDVSFGSERARGVEVGAKGMFLDNRLRLSAAVYRYRFSDLQVSVFNPERFAYIVSNAGVLNQTGAELEANFRASSMLSLHGAIAWTRNRFKDYVGQCYGYTFPTGTTRANAVAPAPCTFIDNTSLTLQQDYAGRPPARSPEWAGNAGFELTAPMGANDIRFTGDAFFSDGYFAADTLQADAYQNSFWRFNAGVTFGPSDERWSVGLIGRNLTNKYYLLYATGRTGGGGLPGAVAEQRGLTARGREIAIQAGFKF